MMRVLVTRPEQDAAPLAEALKARGYEPVLEPLLRIQYLDGEIPDLAGIDALAFTSANGVRALVHAVPDAAATGLKVFAVGPVTAAAAEAAGFKDVAIADGNVAALAELIEAQLIGAETALRVLHVTGSQQSGNLSGVLERAGVPVWRTVLYEAQPAEDLSDGTRNKISNGDLQAVLIFSPRTARLFVNLVERAGLVENIRGMALFTLSPAVAEAAGALPWGAVRIAGLPNGDAVLAALDDFVAEDRNL